MKQNRCRCLLGTIPLQGECLNQQQANAYCGKGHHWENGGCAPDRCRPGDELDATTGLCIPHEQVAQVAANQGVAVGQGQQLGCPAGQKLVVADGKAACVPLAQTCTRDETWNGQACVKLMQCPTGQIFDTALGQCVQYAKSGGDDGIEVNVLQWAQSNYGPNGGSGTSAFCASFAKKPWSFGVTEGATAVVRVTVQLSFPDGQVAKATEQTSTVFDMSGTAVPPQGAANVDAAAREILSTLVAGKGRANAPSATTTVKCAVQNASKPVAVPATGGF